MHIQRILGRTCFSVGVLITFVHIVGCSDGASDGSTEADISKAASQCPGVGKCLSRLPGDKECSKQAPEAWQATVYNCLFDGGGSGCANKCTGKAPALPVEKTACYAPAFDKCVNTLGKNFGDCDVHCPEACQKDVRACLENGSGGMGCARVYCGSI
jgi:hypothetical protein